MFNRRRFPIYAALVGVFVFLSPLIVNASESGGGHENIFPLTFLFIVFMLLAARIGALAERIGQPSVLGELLIGVILGALVFIPGLHFIEDFRSNEIIAFFAEVGVVLLLFQVGLESNIKEMSKVGIPALLVAIVGVVAPFLLGTWVVGPWLLPELTFNAHLFLGATLTATSVGISARVFKDLKAITTRAAKVVLGAAVIDDVLGLLILAVVSAIVSAGSVSTSEVLVLLVKAVGFLVGSIVVGHYSAPYIGKLFSRIHSGVGMKMALAISVAAVFAYGAHVVGLAPIVGAFAAGLVLDSVHFKHFRSPRIAEKLRECLSRINGDLQVSKDIKSLAYHEERKHVEDLIEGVANFFVPIFFVYTGMQVNLEVLTDLPILGIAAAITVIAILGKIITGIFAGKGVNKWIVGVGMIPRGEVGLIFANVGLQIGVIDDRVFAIVVIMVMATTLITPPILSWIIKREKPDDIVPAVAPAQ